MLACLYFTRQAPTSHVMAWVLWAGPRPASSQRLHVPHVPAGRGTTRTSHAPDAQARCHASRAARPHATRTDDTSPPQPRQASGGVVTTATQRAGPRLARHSPSLHRGGRGSEPWHSSGPSGAFRRSKGCGPHSGRVSVRTPVHSLEDRLWTAWDRYPRGTCPA
jgi:hypothetical protein